MAILQVQKPTPQAQQAPEESSLDKLVGILGTGLNLASSVYGIKTNMSKLDQIALQNKMAGEQQTFNQGLATEQFQFQKDKATGKIAPTQPELLSKGFMPTGEDQKGTLMQVSSGGEQKQMSFLTPAQIKENEKKAIASLNENIRNAETELKSTETEFKRVDTLGKRYDNDLTTKNTKLLGEAVQKIRNVGNDTSAAGDLALIFNYMKVLDPGSTVREGEFANAQNAGSIPDRITSQYNRIKSGERLSSNQRADFLNQTENLYKAQLSRQEHVDRRFTKLANKYNIDPESVIDMPTMDPNSTLREGEMGISSTTNQPQKGKGFSMPSIIPDIQASEPKKGFNVQQYLQSE